VSPPVLPEYDRPDEVPSVADLARRMPDGASGQPGALSRADRRAEAKRQRKIEREHIRHRGGRS
jgi:hypothetical protein